MSGVLIRAFEHVAVVRFHGGKILLKPGKILGLAPSGNARKNMIDAEEKPALGEIHQQRNQVVAPAQELVVLPLVQVVNADMSFGPARHSASEFFANEEIRMPPQSFRAFYRVVVGEGEQVHTTSLQKNVQL